MRAAVAIAALALLAPSVAQASTASVGTDGVLRYTAAKGEANSMSVSFLYGGYRFDDSVPITAGRHCTPVPHGVQCTPGGVKSIVVSLGDGNDNGQVNAGATSASPPYTWVHIRVPVTLSGGPGQDALFADGSVAKSPDKDTGRGPTRLEGGPSSDLLFAGVGPADVLLGQGGGDELDGNPLDHGQESHAKLIGGPGSDSLAPKGHDVAHGGKGPDYLDSTQASFREKLYGDAGDDSFRLCSHHADHAYGGHGRDLNLDTPDRSDVLRSIISPNSEGC